MNICIIGTGFVGVVSAAVYASFGNKVIGLDIDPQKIEKLKHGEVPFFEPGLTELLIEQQKTGNLHFTTDYKEAISASEIIFVAVGTPSAPSGEADLKYVFMTADSMAPYLKEQSIIVIKSTVPPGTLTAYADRVKAKTSVPFYMASVPEFLREGTAVNDTLHPDRVVIGAVDNAGRRQRR
jgi:UDPglucose 6-dehydrogenase